MVDDEFDEKTLDDGLTELARLEDKLGEWEP